jgi:hypothetical protein
LHDPQFVTEGLFQFAEIVCHQLPNVAVHHHCAGALVFAELGEYAAGNGDEGRLG